MIATAIGRNNNPIPSTSRARVTYIRPEADRIWPHVRRRPIRSGATGVHVALTTTSTTSPKMIASVASMGPGLLTSRVRSFEPFATPPQNRSVAPVPNTPPVGTA